MGQGLPFRAACFDGAVSISALQWLCYEDSKAQSANARLMRFFASLYTVLRRGARAALQFYPENSEQVLLITQAATRVGFQGGLVVDYPNSSKAKKYYLCLSFEHSYRVPQALGREEGGRALTSVGVTERERVKPRGRKKGGKREQVKSREWVLAKKEKQRRKGLDVREDSKYTARKRKDRL
ncbi:putative methyltransferase wbscr22 [Nannochloropsis gaditana]|nr:putative methyltransferase wbscr22 [Nannochloropsis gaditana]